MRTKEVSDSGHVAFYNYGSEYAQSRTIRSVSMRKASHGPLFLDSLRLRHGLDFSSQWHEFVKRQIGKMEVLSNNDLDEYLFPLHIRSGTHTMRNECFSK